MIQFGEWLPDQPALTNPGATVAKNVIPAARGYRCVRSRSFIDSVGSGEAFNAAYGAKTPAQSFLFAGSAGALWRYNSTDADYDDVSNGSATYTNTGRWGFTTFGADVIAAGGDSTPLQVFDLNSSTEFDDLAGSPPAARFITTVKDFVMCGYVTYSAATHPRRVYWSALDDPTGWTIGTDLSDMQDLPDSGVITGLHGGEEATILLERGIYKGYFTGEADTIFQFDRISVDRGCPYPGASAQIGSAVFFLSEDGFWSLTGAEMAPIGSEKVDEWFTGDFDIAHRNKITCAVDPVRKIVAWSYVSQGSPDGTNDSLIIYNYAVRRWSYARLRADALFPLYMPGISLDDLDKINPSIDALEFSLDDPSLAGGELNFATVVGDRIATFGGPPMTGTVETAEQGEGRNSLIRRVYPHTRAATQPDVSVQVGTRQSQQGTVAWSPASAVQDVGWAATRAAGRYHRVRLTINGNAWEQVQGVDVEAVPLGNR